MPAVRTVKIIAVFLVGLFLSVPRAALAQGLDEAATLNQQVLQLYSQGRYSEAIPLAQRALAIREKALGSDHPEVAQSLNNPAELYRVQVEVVISLNNLAELYRIQGRYADAEPLFKRSLAINEKALGPEHPNVATSLNNLAALYESQGRYTDAEPVYQRASNTRENTRSESPRRRTFAK